MFSFIVVCVWVASFVTIESLQEVVYDKSIGTKMNYLGLRLEVVPRSRQPLCYI